MCIFDTKPKFKIKIWIPDDITSINFVHNKCQVCLVQKGYIYYVQDIIDVFYRCNIGIPRELYSHYHFKGKYLLADKLLYVLFCAEIYLGRVYIAIQDSAVTFANAIIRFLIFFPIIMTFLYSDGGKVGTSNLFEMNVIRKIFGFEANF